eukprot:TRINITY_DN19821_c0_g1_i1.p1 TRINITY_DN19821_c0_g1~~TRINITY_DN19821_c0_g1_i1.p1  ORF type:complete len:409 (+),score=45.74 TRINITY_DN19821_c0_g1_i1:245-1471(+)
MEWTEEVVSSKLVARIHAIQLPPSLLPAAVVVTIAVVWFPLAWAAMWTTLWLFVIAIAVANLTKLPGLQMLQLLIPMADRVQTVWCWLYHPLSAKPYLSSDDHRPHHARTVELSVGTCRYKVDAPTGSSNGEYVVLVHGVSMTMDMWDWFTDALTDAGFTVLRYDLYGHGQSATDPAIAYSLPTFVLQLRELLTTVAPDQPNISLVGFSLGGLVSLEFTSSHPRTVSQLVLIDPCGLAAPPLPLSCTGAFIARGIYSAVRAQPIRGFSAAAGSFLLGWFGEAFDVTIADLRHALRTQRHFHSRFGRLYSSLWLLLISWSYQQRLSDRSAVYNSFLSNLNPFGCFAGSLARLHAKFDGRALLVWGESDGLCRTSSRTDGRRSSPGRGWWACLSAITMCHWRSLGAWHRL